MGDSRRVRLGIPKGVVVVLGVALVASGITVGTSAAHADTTAQSTTYKTATDTTNGSSAASAAAPGGAITGSANPGDTIKWVLDYKNSTGRTANVTVSDPISGGQSLVPGSVQAPTGWSISGANNLVSGTGTATATNQRAAQFATGGSSIQQPSGGDGFNAMFNTTQALNVYTSYHHHSPSLTCVSRAGGLCQGWSQGTYFFNPANPTAALTTTQPAGLTWGTVKQNFTVIDPSSGKQYGLIISGTNGIGTATVEIACIDTNTAPPTGCGVFQPVSGVSAAGMLQFSGDGNYYTGAGLTRGSDGNLYWFTGNAAGAVTQHCFNPTTSTACSAGDGIALLSGGATIWQGQQHFYQSNNIQAFGHYIFSSILRKQTTGTGGNSDLVCYDITRGALCAGWPANGIFMWPSPAQLGGELLPLLDASGTLTGICNSGSANTLCFNLDGTPVPTPVPWQRVIGANFSVGYSIYEQVVAIGSRVYYLTYSDNVYRCYDFATGAACAGFSGPTMGSTYTLVPDPVNANCLWSDGDNGVLLPFSAQSGGVGCTVVGGATVSPPQNFCDGQTRSFNWQNISFSAPPTNQFSNYVVTIYDANGAVVTGTNGVTWNNRQTPSTTTSIDISTIGYGTSWSNGLGGTFNTTTLRFVLGFAGVSAPFTAQPAATISWGGPTDYQVCYQTVVSPVGCGQSSTVSDTAALVTNATGSGGVTDGPSGNSTGVAQFTVTPRADQCKLEFQKTASSSPLIPGVPVTYTVTVENTGSMPYSAPAPAVFNDDLGSILADATYGNDATASVGTTSYTAPMLSWTGPANFAPGDTATIHYTATVKSPDTGPHLLRNAVTSTSPGANCAPGSTDTACSVDVPVNELAIVKQGTTTDNPIVKGSVIHYSFLVTNTGFQTLTNINVTDAQAAPAGALDGPIVCPTTTLAPGASTTCTATYTVTQADADNGKVLDTAVAHGTPPNRPDGSTPPVVDSPPGDAVVPAPPVPAVQLVKTVSPTSVGHAGQTVTYSFAIMNTGNVSLDPISIEETAFSGTGSLSAVSCPSGSLAPLETATCTATYTLTQADVDAGRVTNTARALATPPGATTPIHSNDWSAVVDVVSSPHLSLVKTATPGKIASAGDVVSYSFRVTNDGNLTLHGISITETTFSGTGHLTDTTCPVTTLAPGEHTTCTASYTSTQADVDAGKIDNTATAGGMTPGEVAVVSTPSDFEVTAPATPGIALVKTADRTVVDAVGQTIGYTFAVTNTGNVTLDEISIMETSFTGAGSLSAIICPTEPLAPGEVTSCTARYITVPADAHLTSIDNTATARGVPPTGDPTESSASSADVPVHIPAPVVPADLPPTGGTRAEILPGLLTALALTIAGIGVLLFSRRFRRDRSTN